MEITQSSIVGNGQMEASIIAVKIGQVKHLLTANISVIYSSDCFINVDINCLLVFLLPSGVCMLFVLHFVLSTIICFDCVCVCVQYVIVKVKPLLFLCLACLYDVALYWYMYTRLQDGTMERAGLLGFCSSLLTSVLMTLPAFEVVSTRVVQ